MRSVLKWLSVITKLFNAITRLILSVLKVLEQILL
jgi:hypothetical protein